MDSQYPALPRHRLHHVHWHPSWPQSSLRQGQCDGRRAPPTPRAAVVRTQAPGQQVSAGGPGRGGRVPPECSHMVTARVDLLWSELPPCCSVTQAATYSARTLQGRPSHKTPLPQAFCQPLSCRKGPGQAPDSAAKRPLGYLVHAPGPGLSPAAMCNPSFPLMQMPWMAVTAWVSGFTPLQRDTSTEPPPTPAQSVRAGVWG